MSCKEDDDMDSRSAIAWDRADLVRRLARALAAAGRAVERLAVAGHGDALDHAGEARPHGVVSDTALLLLAASEVDSEPEIAAEADRIALRLIG
jgi:hypothetical protein